MTEHLSPMELSLLAEFHKRFGNCGFPAPENVRLAERRQSGAGRHVELHCALEVDLQDGPIGIGHYSHLQMEGVPNGMVVLAYIENRRLVELELTVNGEGFWDGGERTWSLITD